MSIAPRSLRPVKVLFVMPPCLPTPPIGYGGIEAVAAALLPELEAAGVRATVTTPIGSTIKVTRRLELCEPIYPILSHPYNDVVPSIEEYVARVMDVVWTGTFDVIHDFSGMLAILNTIAAPLRGKSGYPPVIHTIHGPIAPYIGTYNRLVKAKNLIYTGISEAQLSAAPTAIRRRTKIIYNGLNPADYAVGQGSSGRLLVLGRICDDKGQDRLIEYCAANNIGLDVAGTVAELSTVEEIERVYREGETNPLYNKKDFQTFARVHHLIDGNTIKFHGNVGGQLKTDLLSQATALVVPNRWSEPFGMVAIEAMASGTPVIAMNTGAMPELIKDGITGYLTDTFDELCAKLNPEAINKLRRADSRRHVEANFSITAIAAQYIELYHEMMSPAPAATTITRPLIGALPPRQSAVLYEQLPLATHRRKRTR